jgi:hypothetical protein
MVQVQDSNRTNKLSFNSFVQRGDNWCHCRTLEDLCITIKREHPDMLTRGIIVLIDNAHPLVAHTVQDMLHSMNLKVSDKPPYCRDLLPCDFNVSGSLKKALQG